MKDMKSQLVHPTLCPHHFILPLSHGDVVEHAVTKALDSQILNSKVEKCEKHWKPMAQFQPLCATAKSQKKHFKKYAQQMIMYGTVN